jgi:lipopolysaccharide/colanic/teichoic acid biosynthesis glycosyltransferase
MISQSQPFPMPDDSNQGWVRPSYAFADRRQASLVAPQERRIVERRSQTLEVLHERRRRESAASVRTALPSSQPTRSLALERLHAGLPFVAAEGNPCAKYRTAKRLLDIVGASAILLVASPVILTALVVLTITTGGRPLFVQRRLGHLGRPFRIFKFRTMHLNAEKMKKFVVNESDGPVFKNRRDPRITRIGQWLRSTSIDELPQLINVLMGDMSLVGPRPPLAEEVAKYEPWQRRRLAVQPGLTCLWQISGRSDVAFDDWVRMDLWYVRNQSLWSDVRLLWKTPYSVLSRRGAY